MAEILRFQSPRITGEVDHSCEQLLEDALEARQKFLSEHPHLQAYQDEIDRILQKVPGISDRMVVIGILMQAKINELKEAIAELVPPNLKADTVLAAGRQNGNDQREHGILH